MTDEDAPRGNRPGRPIAERDRRALLEELDAWSSKGRFAAVRDRALYVLCLTTAIRLAEALRLDLEDVIERPTQARPRIVSQFYLSRAKAKGEPKSAKRAGYTSARSIYLPEPARRAIALYLAEAKRRGWIPCAPWSGPLFLTVKGRGKAGHTRLAKRTAQAHFRAWQERARIVDAYRFHDLRHTALSRLAGASNGDVHTVAVLAGHTNPAQTLTYLHSNPERLAALTEKAARGVRT